MTAADEDGICVVVVGEKERFGRYQSRFLACDLRLPKLVAEFKVILIIT